MSEVKIDEGQLVDKPAWEQGWSLQNVFDYLNDELFEGKLPPTMLCLSRNQNILGGYFTPERWYNEDGKAVGEIAINANNIKGQGMVRTFTIMIHEMVHLWQFSFGNPSRSGYHNQEWANKCKEIGLQPFTADDKEIGQAVDTKLITGGKAETVIAEMPEHFTLPWMTEPLNVEQGGGGGEGGQGGGPPDDPRQPKPKRPGSRFKYTCPACGFNLWGKAGGNFECLDCKQLIIQQKEGDE